MMTALDNADNVFVYGTLREGESNHDWLAQARFLGSCNTRPQYTMFDMGGYPGVIARGHTVIAGEVYQIDDWILQQLDELEEVPEYFQRERIVTRFGPAWIYILSATMQAHMNSGMGIRYAKVQHGDWVKYRRAHE